MKIRNVHRLLFNVCKVTFFSLLLATVSGGCAKPKNTSLLLEELKNQSHRFVEAVESKKPEAVHCFGDNAASMKNQLEIAFRDTIDDNQDILPRRITRSEFRTFARYVKKISVIRHIIRSRESTKKTYSTESEMDLCKGKKISDKKIIEIALKREQMESELKDIFQNSVPTEADETPIAATREDSEETDDAAERKDNINAVVSFLGAIVTGVNEGVEESHHKKRANSSVTIKDPEASPGDCEPGRFTMEVNGDSVWCTRDILCNIECD